MSTGELVRAWFRRRSPAPVCVPGVKHAHGLAILVGRAPFLVPALGQLIEAML